MGAKGVAGVWVGWGRWGACGGVGVRGVGRGGGRAVRRGSARVGSMLRWCV